MADSKVDLNLRWQDQNVIKKDGEWTVDGCAAYIKLSAAPNFASPQSNPHSFHFL
jgi:hypothetical protein